MKTICVYFADGFEELEALTPVNILRRGGCEVIMVSVTPIKQVKSSRGVVIVADKLFEEVDYNDVEMIVLPGGVPGYENLNKHEKLKDKILELNQKGIWLTAICGAPKIFGHLGLLKGKKATCHPTIEPELIGASYTGRQVEIDGNIITAQGAGVSIIFSLTLLEVLEGKHKVMDVKELMMLE